MTVIYGIKNCDTMRKAFTWLDKHKVEYSFHDYKKEGIDRARLEKWVKAQGWEVLLNRAGTTFKKLSDKDKDGITEKKAIALMLAQPSMIKRPVVEFDATGQRPGKSVRGTDLSVGRVKLLVGFKPDEYEKLF